MPVKDERSTDRRRRPTGSSRCPAGSRRQRRRRVSQRPHPSLIDTHAWSPDPVHSDQGFLPTIQRDSQRTPAKTARTPYLSRTHTSIDDGTPVARRAGQAPNLSRRHRPAGDGGPTQDRTAPPRARRRASTKACPPIGHTCPGRMAPALLRARSHPVRIVVGPSVPPARGQEDPVVHERICQPADEGRLRVDGHVDQRARGRVRHHLWPVGRESVQVIGHGRVSRQPVAGWLDPTGHARPDAFFAALARAASRSSSLSHGRRSASRRRARSRSNSSSA